MIVSRLGNRLGEKKNSYRPWFESFAGMKQWHRNNVRAGFHCCVTAEPTEFFRHIIISNIGAPLTLEIGDSKPNESIVVVKDRFFALSGF